MSSRVTEYERPVRFVGKQVRGPFPSLRPEHLFDDAGEGLVRMTDPMTVTAPLGVEGSAVARLFLMPYRRRLLAERAGHMQVIAEQPDR